MKMLSTLDYEIEALEDEVEDVLRMPKPEGRDSYALGRANRAELLQGVQEALERFNSWASAGSVSEKALARSDAVFLARFALEKEPVYLDTETSGLGPHDEVVEISIIDHDGKPLFDSLIRPHVPIPKSATRVHGISDIDVRDAPTWEEAWPSFAGLVQGRLLCVYNAEFDLRMMAQSCSHAGIPFDLNDISSLCVMKLYAQFLGDWDSYHCGWRWHRLEAAGRRLGISLPNSHRALDDTRLARAVMLAMGQAQASAGLQPN